MRESDIFSDRLGQLIRKPNVGLKLVESNGSEFVVDPDSVQSKPNKVVGELTKGTKVRRGGSRIRVLFRSHQENFVYIPVRTKVSNKR